MLPIVYVKKVSGYLLSIYVKVIKKRDLDDNGDNDDGDNNNEENGDNDGGKGS